MGDEIGAGPTLDKRTPPAEDADGRALQGVGAPAMVKRSARGRPTT